MALWVARHFIGWYMNSPTEASSSAGVGVCAFDIRVSAIWRSIPADPRVLRATGVSMSLVTIESGFSWTSLIAFRGKYQGEQPPGFCSGPGADDGVAFGSA